MKTEKLNPIFFLHFHFLHLVKCILKLFKDYHIYLNRKKMEKKEIKCDLCNVSFDVKRDLDRHLKTNKHIKRSLEIDYSKCPYCDYYSDDKSNMNKHLTNVHEFETEKVLKNIDKKAKDTQLPKLIIKQYYTLKEAEKTLRMVYIGKNSRLKMLKNRMYKDDEEEVIQTKKDIEKARLNYNDTLIKLKELELSNPKLVELPPPPQDEKSIKENKKLEEEEKKEEDEEKIKKDKQKERQDKIDKIHILIEENKQLYITSKGDKKYKEKIIELEKELNLL